MERHRKFFRSNSFFIAEHPRQTLYDLRKDNAGVTSRALKSAARKIYQYLRTVSLQIFYFFNGRSKGQRHIRTRIAVRHGEDVQRVDLSLMKLKISVSAEKHFFQLCTVYNFH